MKKFKVSKSNPEETLQISLIGKKSKLKRTEAQFIKGALDKYKSLLAKSERLNYRQEEE